MTLPEEPPPLDLARLLKALHQEQVVFVVVGGVAAIAHGSTSITTDLDICYDPAQPNVRALARTLKALDARLFDGKRRVNLPIDHRTLAHGDFFMFHTAAGELDCLLRPDGTDGFDDLRRGAERFPYMGTPVMVASLDDLIRMKSAAGRPRDLIELDRLLAIRDEIDR